MNDAKTKSRWMILLLGLCLMFVSVNAAALVSIEDHSSYKLLSTDRMITEPAHSRWDSNFRATGGGGDVNGDGFEDIIAVVGNGGADNAPTTEAVIYYGNAEGVLNQRTYFHESSSVNTTPTSMDIIGDINGDGYDDIALGAPSGDGAVYIYLGSASGLVTTPHAVLQGLSPAMRLGFSVRRGGDINNDGYADLVVGAPYYSNGENEEGAVYIYLGSPAGFQATPDMILESDRTNARFGFSVSGGGDINGDGFDDVVVGSPGKLTSYSNRQPEEIGYVYIFLGGAGGISNVPSETLIGSETDVFCLGFAVTVVGDLNGDGFADIGASENYTGGTSTHGNIRTRIFYGAQQGISNPQTPQLLSNGEGLASIFSTNEFNAIGRARDINADGYDDLVLLNHRSYVVNDTSQIAGNRNQYLKVYLGSENGVELSRLHTIYSTQNYIFNSHLSMGTASDFDGDGLPDISYSNNGDNDGSDTIQETYNGELHLFLSKPFGITRSIDLDSDVQLVSGGQTIRDIDMIGDVNGDGYEDAIFADPEYNSGQGEIELYLGSATGKLSRPVNDNLDVLGQYYGNNSYQALPGVNVRSLDQLQEYDDQGVNEHFGARVSGAGDINGDGYDDVIVLAAGEILTGCNTGGSAIYIFHGGPAGLDAAPHTILAPKNGHVFLEVAGGGDANGDGFDDIAIIDANLPATCAGTATYFPGDILVFPGSTDGVYIPPATPDSPPILAPFDVTPWLYTDNGTTFTRKPTLKFTGDVNGDGYGEFVFSTKSGINSSTSTVSILLLGNQQAANFDYLYYATGGNNSDLEPSTRPAVVAGDFNGDNYADVVFSGGRSLNPNFLGNGAAWVFYGRASIGSSATQDNATENLGELLFDQIIFLTFPIRLEGEELKAGDINGDAFTDLTIAGRTDVYLRLGTPDGIMIDHIKKPIVSAIGYGFSEQNTAMGDHTLGDVNGDGYVDIVSQYTPDLNNPTADSDDYIILYGRATDLDMDGVTDTQDAFPFDTFETVDTDGDGVGDNADVAPNDPGRTTTQPPVITPISDQIVDVGETLEVIVEVSDADGDVPTLSLMSSPAFATITGNTISLAPTAIDLGHFTITVEADDGFKGVSTLSFGVTVSDSTAPEVVVVPGPANPPYQFFIGAVDANGTPATHTEIASILEMVYAQDNVDGTIDNASIVNDAPSQFPIGDTVVTFAATDSAGNTGTNTATFTIADTTAPALVVPADISIQLDAGNSLALSDSRIASFLGGATAMDNVDGVVPVTNNAPASLALGVTTVIFAAADSSGNNSAGPSTITLTSLDNDSDGMPNSFEVANGLDQNDPADASGDLDGDGLTNLEEYEQGTDVAVDSVPPILTVPASVSIELVSGNSVSSSDSRIVDFLSGASAKDGVDGVVDVTDDAPATFGLGTTTVTFTARDAADNISSEPSTIVVTSLDNDGDGLPNSFESANGLDMNDPSDAAGDLDGDGLSNLDEYLQGGNIAVDDVDPMLTIPSDIVVNSTGPLTPVDFSGVTASDVLDGAITPVADTPGPFTPGRHIVTWIATDQAGNSATAQQIVDVIPMVSFSPSETVDEGSSVTIDVTLNGNAVAYPVSVPYTVGGTAANPADHNASSGTVEITSGTQGTITLNTVADALPEGEETIVFTLGTPVNAVPGAVSEHIVTIVETNIAPAVSLVIRQGGKPVTTVVTGAGVVELSVEINDPNPNDSHAFDWSGTDNSLVPQEGYTAATFTFDPSSLVEGIYQLATLVSDNGVPVLSADAKALINVTTTAPVLSDTSDTDGDGIADADEGISDSDMDRIPDYLDAVDEPNLLPTDTSNSAVLQTDAGLDLRLGQTAFASGSGGAQVSIDDINNHGGAAGGVASNADPNQFDFPAGIFDFEVTGLESGASARIVQPLSVAIPPDATYRKYFADTGWFDFVENADNVVSSAPGQPGVCPAPGDATYVAGLNEGNFCVQLTIEDGGPNDADASADGVVRDPGGIAVVVDANGNQDSGNGTPDNGNQNPDPGSGDGPGSNGAGSGGSDGGGGALSTTGLVFMLCWLLLVFIRTKRYDDIGDGDE